MLYTYIERERETHTHSQIQTDMDTETVIDTHIQTSKQTKGRPIPTDEGTADVSEDALRNVLRSFLEMGSYRGPPEYEGRLT